MQTSVTRGVLLTGTIGAGKSAVAAEIHEILEERSEASAVIDVDWLGWTTLPNFRELMYRNLSAVWSNYRAAGIDYLVLARLVESEAEIDEYRRALPGVDLSVVHLTADLELVRARLERRDTGAVLDEHLEETEQFAQVLEGLSIADLTVRNDDRPVRAVADEVLAGLGWK